LEIIEGLSKIKEEEEFNDEIPKLIYNEMTEVEDFKENYEARFKILEVIKDIQETKNLQRTIIEDIINKFKYSEECISKAILFYYQNKTLDYEFDKAILNDFSEISNYINSKEIYHLYSKYCIDLINKYKEDKEKTKYLLDHLLNKIYNDANEKNLINSEMGLNFLKIILSFGLYDLTSIILPRMIKKFKKNNLIWEFAIKFHILIKKEHEFIMKMINESLNHVENTFEYWEFILSIVVSNNDPIEIKKYFQKSFKYDLRFKEKFFRWMLFQYGPEGVDMGLDVLINFPPLEMTTFKLIMKYLSNKDSIIKLYDRMIETNGSENHQLWIDYIVYMKGFNDFQKVNFLYYEATKKLQNPQLFIENYNLIK
jgi:hypothetical protein